MVRIKRAYEPAEPADGYRVLVERLWPRGVRKDQARLDEWMKDVAPSDALRKWFHHDEARWLEFRRRYRRELRDAPARGLVEALVRRAKRETMTLIYAAHDARLNSAIVLAAELERRLGASRGPRERALSRRAKLRRELRADEHQRV